MTCFIAKFRTSLKSLTDPGPNRCSKAWHVTSTRYQLLYNCTIANSWRLVLPSKLRPSLAPWSLHQAERYSFAQNRFFSLSDVEIHLIPIASLHLPVVLYSLMAPFRDDDDELFFVVYHLSRSLF